MLRINSDDKRINVPVPMTLQPQHEDDTAPTQHNRAVRRPLIRLVDDVTLARNLEIGQFQDQKNHEDDSKGQSDRSR